MKCGYCGMPISAECGTSKTGEKKYYYKCLGKKKYRNGCQQAPIRKDVLENYMDEAIVDTLVDSLYDRQNKQLEEQAAVNLLTKELRQVEHSLDNIVAASEKGIVSLTTNKRLHELETRQQELELSSYQRPSFAPTTKRPFCWRAKCRSTIWSKKSPCIMTGW